MTKVTVITLQNVRNYGSALQALATQKVFERLGCEVNFIDYWREGMREPWKRAMGYCHNAMDMVIKPFVLYPSFIVQDKHFSQFLKEYLHTIPVPCQTEEDFKKLPLDSDIYCTGSDQTWNSDWNGGILGPLFLDFVPKGKKKIAYSASFGKSKLDDFEIEATRNYLKQYDAISVREKSAVDIIDGLGIPGAVHVLDPTLQLDRNFWKQYAGEVRYKEPYVLIYQLNSNKQFDRYAKEFAKRKGYKLVRFCYRYDQALKCGTPALMPKVLDFVNLIYHASCVITDSFHATAFSINCNTNFISICPHEFSSRLGSILQLTHLEGRHLTRYDDFSFADYTNVDFSEANEILEAERQKGWDFLKKAIEP